MEQYVINFVVMPRNKYYNGGMHRSTVEKLLQRYPSTLKDQSEILQAEKRIREIKTKEFENCE